LTRRTRAGLHPARSSTATKDPVHVLGFYLPGQERGLLPSLGTVGDPYDNAVVALFCGRMQVELLNRQRWHPGPGSGIGGPAGRSPPRSRLQLCPAAAAHTGCEPAATPSRTGHAADTAAVRAAIRISPRKVCQSQCSAAADKALARQPR
jgi:hypothetical protein